MAKLTSLLFIVISFAFSFNLYSSEAKATIVPKPMNMTQREGAFVFKQNTSISVENSEQADVAKAFTELFEQASGVNIAIKTNEPTSDIRFITDGNLKSESYIIDVTTDSIVVKASDAKGFFYALQTIRLLLPAAIETVNANQDEWSIPALYINDEPRFGYRGVMLDVSRFFIPKENVLRIIDCMSMLKLNKLHLHLVDDNGWRIEIKQYPKLTEVGAWHVDRSDAPYPARRNAVAGEETPIGGFYTQDDIREMIAYADARQVEIIPEIEMPAHTVSSLAAYPELACPVVTNFIGVAPGMANNLLDIIYCAGNDSVYTFIENVLDEVIALFPSNYLHLGGDEAIKKYWEKCPRCQQRIKDEGLKCEEDLQGYFMNRIASYVRSKGKEVMGWDELTNATLPEDVIIYGWQGMGKAALKAAEQGHRFIMTPARALYLIRYQGPQWFEPITYFGNNTLKDVYDYEPVQSDWKPQYESLLMGVQGSLWTEFCNTPQDVDYLLFPRLAAVAEIAWSEKDKRDWPHFLKAVDNYNNHIANKGVVGAKSMYNIQHTVTPVDGQLQVKLECIRPDMQIHYTLDGSNPTSSSPIYNVPLLINQSCEVSSATFSNGQQMGQTLVLPIEWNKATAKPLITNTSHTVLTNGIRGSLKQTDFEWASWASSDSASMTIDLLEQLPINEVSIGSITNYGMAIHKPKSIVVEVSTDNVKYKKLGELTYSTEQIFQEGNFVEDCTLKTKKTKARYVRITAKGPGNCPAGHVRESRESRIMFDEITVK